MGRAAWAAIEMCVALALAVIGITLIVADLGLVLGGSALLAIVLIALISLPPRLASRMIVFGILTGVTVLLLDFYWPFPRQSSGLANILPFILGGLLLAFGTLAARKFSSYGLRTKLILAFVLVSLVPLGLVAALNNQFTLESLTNAVNQSLSSGAKQTASTLEAFFTTTKTTMQTETNLPEWRNYLELPPDQRTGSLQERAVNEVIQTLAQKDSRIASYQLLDRSGSVVASDNSLDLGQDKQNEAYFQVPFKEGKSYISPVVFSGNALNGDFFIGVRIIGSSAGPIGVLVARYSAEDTFPDLVNPRANLNPAGPQSFAVLFDENHLIQAHDRHLHHALTLVKGFGREDGLVIAASQALLQVRQIQRGGGR